MYEPNSARDEWNEQQKLGAPPGAVYNVNLVRPTSGGALPMRRIFEDEDGNRTGELDLQDYGYDARKRVWYRDTMQAARAECSDSTGTNSARQVPFCTSWAMHSMMVVWGVMG